METNGPRVQLRLSCGLSDPPLTFFFMNGSSLVSKRFLFLLRGLSSSRCRGTASRGGGGGVGGGGRFFGGSSSFLFGQSSRSAFLFTAQVVFKAATVAGAGAGVGGGGSASSLGSRFSRGSFSREPGRLEAYLKPGPRFCFFMRTTQKQQRRGFVRRVVGRQVHAYLPGLPGLVALGALPAVGQLVVDHPARVLHLRKKTNSSSIPDINKQTKNP